jgi:sugar phosphate permease
MTDSNRHRYRIFYGWWIVIACLLISAYTTGIIGHGFTAIFEPIAKEFSWSYAKVSIAASIRGLEGGILAPIVGLLFNRLGGRKIIFAGIAITGLSLLLLSRASSLWMFYGAIFLVATSMSITVGVIPIAVVGNWFRRNVTLATGIVVSGTAIGGFMVPLLTKMIDTYGWREAMLIVGIAALLIILPLSLIIRQKPEQYGYLPDGKTSKHQTSNKMRALPPTIDVEIGVRQAIKSRAFWHTALGMTCSFLIVATVTTHVMPYLSTVGFNRSTSSFVATALPLTSILGRLGFGWLGDRLNKKLLLVVSCALLSLSMLFFGLIGTVGTWLVIPFIIFFGIGWGSSAVLPPTLLREYFGRVSLGTLLGFSIGMGHLITVAGPPLAGWVFDKYGNYFSAWVALAGIAFIAIIIFLTTPSVAKQSE